MCKWKNGEDWAINFEWFYGICIALFVGYVLCVYIIQLGSKKCTISIFRINSTYTNNDVFKSKRWWNTKKWGKQCLSTYLDVFIRVAILYFILLAFKAITEADLFATGSIPIGIVLLIGLMMFAKKVPNLLKKYSHLLEVLDLTLDYMISRLNNSEHLQEELLLGE